MSEERCQALEKNIHEAYKLIHKCEGALLTCGDPRERFRLENVIDETKKHLERFEAQLALLKPVRTVEVETAEHKRLLQELRNLSTTHQRRYEIGDRLDEIRDLRSGISLLSDGLPDIEWLSVKRGGKVELADNGGTFSVQPFYIAKYPVTYAQYEAFVRAKDGYYNLEWWKGMPKEYQPQKLKEQNHKLWNCPRDNISWYQSVAFMRWLNYRRRGQRLPFPGGPANLFYIIGENAEIRLPTEWEWQWAAQGGLEQRLFPWGAWKEGYANTRESGLFRTVSVGMYPHGAALCGAEDMCGNVWEWCLNKYSPANYIQIDNSTNNRVLRGGSFYGSGSIAAVAIRYGNLPDDDYDFYGCRCVLSCPN